LSQNKDEVLYFLVIMDFGYSDEQLELQRSCLNFGHAEITPHLDALENDESVRSALFQKMAQRGLFTLALPEEYGGLCPDYATYALALSAIAKADAGIAVVMSVTNMVAEAIAVYGSQEQRKKYLPLFGNGSCVPASFALTEKNAGSDAKNISTMAFKDASDDHYYILNGEKQFITNADTAGVVIVFAKTDPTLGAKGITAFLVDRGTEGFSVSKIEQKLGLSTAHLVDLRFDRCRLHQSQILGQVGDGFKIALNTLDGGRLGIAAQSIGIAEAAFEAARDYAMERYQFGKPIASHQAIAFKLADMEVKIHASKLLLLKAGWLKDQGVSLTHEAAIAKLYCSEACNEIVNDALQIHGGYGYVKGYSVEKLFRDARATTIYEGTSEIQRLIIAKHLLTRS
jgi:alkylation response protein AidB-like acyl-CoA dehydrogenase